MANEYTPLITTVTVGPVRRRYPHQTIRRFCTVALGSSLIALFITFLATVVFAPQHNTYHGWPGHHKNHLSYEDLKTILLETPSSSKATEWSRYYTSGPHLAGKNLSQAEWTRDRWNEWGINSNVVAYETYINYPVGHRLALLEKTKSGAADAGTWKVAFEASLEEDVLEEDPTSQLEDSVPTFHGYSASGNVTGSFVYVNYGTYWDFEDLIKANVSLEGKIAVARYGGIFRGLKVKRAQELGMIGVVIFTDPGDDGETTEANGYGTYPDGPARNPSSVQRGSVQFLSVAPGDPTTPGYPSKPGVPRAPVDKAIPSIPSLPISYLEALPILKSLNGIGPRAQDFGQYWTRNIGLAYKGVKYNIGPSPDDIMLNLYNEQDYTITPIWNVIGIINGTIPNEVIVVGNHRDAWIAGGAGDPNSGSAVLNEAIRSFGKALEKGWRPLRTIVFASWDGEEYGLVGSTEWVEEYLPWLTAANVAYINVDVGVRGPIFSASAAPLLHKLIYDVTASVQSPNQTIKGQTVRDLWDGRISTMGSGSDFTAFQDFAGVPSLDIGFGEETVNSPIYHYHSNYDSFHWMSEFGDPGFIYHKTMAQVLGLITAKLADVPLLSLNATNYADELKEYIKKVETKLTTSQPKLSTEKDVFEFRARPAGTGVKGDPDNLKNSLGRLYQSVDAFKLSAIKLDTKSERLAKEVSRHIPWWKWISKLKLVHEIRSINTKYKKVERAFLYQLGLDGRPWFKHIVFAPGIWTGYAGAVFPGLDESIDKEDYVNAMKWVYIIDDCIKTATKTIE
ncbi:Zn-dependent exopeptidase [Daldinia caldariorum]|uniref:Zn-dependent exopeptidase n=1 Tax=Daldinia caldariorum TaxID=326644 RepID=UPI002007D40E|nr:Zn-dependent exopeptidase [Daldinia caldariorum]KAI1465294.1 Zn-dependent exopeptidase [Daldinia caldariorum]